MASATGPDQRVGSPQKQRRSPPGVGALSLKSVSDVKRGRGSAGVPSVNASHTAARLGEPGRLEDHGHLAGHALPEPMRHLRAYVPLQVDRAPLAACLGQEPAHRGG